MARCKQTIGLEVHHKRRDGGNELNNAKVLCQLCHGNTSTYGRDGLTPPAFPQKTKDKALELAGHQCECERKICGTH